MKLKLNIVKIFLLTISLNALSGCGGAVDGIGGTGIEPGIESGIPLSDSSGEIIVSGYTIPFNENGYQNLTTSVFHSQEDLDGFITDVNEQISWDDKALFLEQLQSKTIDFSVNNLLIYRTTESSSSVELTVNNPVYEDGVVTITIDRDESEAAVEDTVYYALAYIVDNGVNELVFSSNVLTTPIDLTDTSTAQGKLVKSDDNKLLEYFQSTAKSQSVQNLYWQSIDPAETFAVDSIALEGAPVESSEDNSVSSTNTQEEGVDEADLIKTDGRYLYSIDKSDYFSGDNIRVMDTQGTEGLAEIDNLSSDDEDSRWNIEGLYLHEAQKRLVALSSSSYPYYDDPSIDIAAIPVEPADYNPNPAIPKTPLTDVLFMNVEDPSDTSITTTLSFDGNLVDSRRNGDTLYLVLRDYNYYQYIDNATLLDSTLDEFLPSYTVDNSPKERITVANDCYVEEGQKGSSDIIILVAIDLNSETPEINSQCFVGPTEALYASQNALYLATTRYDYQSNNGENTYDREITTDVHKFAYEGLSFDYRGSGEVDGHLGFNQALKQFRFSEKEGYLRVVTYDVDQWNFWGEGLDEDNSPVLLSILEENTETKSLDLVSTLPNANRPDPIGLPGERLYASRYIGDRAYFVTFRTTDPLYVIDLSDHTDPSIMGELKIDGYSDYLHPISENLLMGIGIEGGVKLSLIDVADPNNPLEADKIILGGSGTSSTALNTHHGVTGLSINDDTYRLAIPVNLRGESYDFIHAGLYRFNVDKNSQTMSLIDPLISASSEDTRFISVFNDRSVIINDDVFYMHDGQFWMQDWEGTTDATGPK